MRVLNFGSLNYDYVYHVEHIALPEETLSSANVEEFVGGKGLNQSIALARAGVQVCHAGRVGDDGEKFFKVCRGNNINTDFLRVASVKSGHAIIQVDENGQNSIILFSGANRRQTREHIKETVSCFAKGDIILLQNEVNCLSDMIECASEQGMTVVLNPSPFERGLLANKLRRVSLFLLNEVEGMQLTGEQETEKILDKMRERYPEAEVVLTLGKRGSVYQKAESRIWQKVFKVNAVDTTAAGDTYTGYFVAGMLEGMLPEENMKRCSAAAAIAVSRKGASTSVPYREEVEDFLSRHL